MRLKSRGRAPRCGRGCPAFQHTSFSCRDPRTARLRGRVFLASAAQMSSGKPGRRRCGVGAFLASLDNMVNAGLTVWFLTIQFFRDCESHCSEPAPVGASTLVFWCGKVGGKRKEPKTWRRRSMYITPARRVATSGPTRLAFRMLRSIQKRRKWPNTRARALPWSGKQQINLRGVALLKTRKTLVFTRASRCWGHARTFYTTLNFLKLAAVRQHRPPGGSQWRSWTALPHRLRPLSRPRTDATGTQRHCSAPRQGGACGTSARTY